MSRARASKRRGITSPHAGVCGMLGCGAGTGSGVGGAAGGLGAADGDAGATGWTEEGTVDPTFAASASACCSSSSQRRSSALFRCDRSPASRSAVARWAACCFAVATARSSSAMRSACRPFSELSSDIWRCRTVIGSSPASVFASGASPRSATIRASGFSARSLITATSALLTSVSSAGCCLR